jgi:hypothetical protein
MSSASSSSSSSRSGSGAGAALLGVVLGGLLVVGAATAAMVLSEGAETHTRSRSPRASGGGERGERVRRGEEEGRKAGEEGARREAKAGGGGSVAELTARAAALAASQTRHPRKKRWLDWSRSRIPGVPGQPGLEEDRLRGVYSELRRQVLAMEATHWAERVPRLADDVAVISRDVPRTFPEDGRFRSLEGQSALRTLLSVFALWDVRLGAGDVGYVQGMNFLAAHLLMVMEWDEAGAFVVLVRLFDDPRYNLRRLFRAGLSGASEAGHEVLETLRLHDARAAAILRAAHVTPEFFFEWYFTLFTVVLPFDLLGDVWDLILADGWVAVVRVAVALLVYAMQQLPHYHDLGPTSPPAPDVVLTALKAFQVFRSSAGLYADPGAAIPAPTDIVQRARAVRIDEECVARWRRKDDAARAGWDLVDAPPPSAPPPGPAAARPMPL